MLFQSVIHIVFHIVLHSIHVLQLLLQLEHSKGDLNKQTLQQVVG